MVINHKLTGMILQVPFNHAACYLWTSCFFSTWTVIKKNRLLRAYRIKVPNLARVFCIRSRYEPHPRCYGRFSNRIWCFFPNTTFYLSWSDKRILTLFFLTNMDFFQPDRRRFEGQHSHFEQCLSGSISQRSGIGTQSLAPSFGRGVQHQIGSLVGKWSWAVEKPPKGLFGFVWKSQNWSMGDNSWWNAFVFIRCFIWNLWKIWRQQWSQGFMTLEQNDICEIREFWCQELGNADHFFGQHFQKRIRCLNVWIVSWCVVYLGFWEKSSWCSVRLGTYSIFRARYDPWKNHCLP